MRCPKCQFDHQLQTTECLKCGIVFARYQAAPERATKQDVTMPVPLSPSTPVTSETIALSDVPGTDTRPAVSADLRALVARPVCELRQPCSPWCCTKVGTPSPPG